ncbi:DUF6440 family protein [Anaerococcus sp. Marseille-Q5996]|uniref:DUF6440 family protein n=1 Tax=Anaerococcus sp. Marseille-Q5996 TaxID=2972769 RepID=UPI0021C85ED7|nr:DUF6440 family protein [Anaerococcus sp. Marseille-Q5996]
MEKADKRFIVKIEDENILFATSLSTVVDTQTGVNYIIASRSSEGVAITPLLDKYGELVISTKEEIEELIHNNK